jgi:putative endonuclease
MYSVYVIQSEQNKKYYIGYTSNFENRLQKHNSGGNISTKNYRPWKLVYSEMFEDKRAAWLRERQIKSYKGGAAFKKMLGLIIE